MDDQNAKDVVESILKGEKPEGYSIDWIQSIENREAIGKKIAAFATSDGGWLVIGIDDGRKVLGIGDKQVFI
jgi:predicted HTH transcriptional regulator